MSTIQLQLSIFQPYHNQYLFSDHYLDNLLPQDSRWSDTLPETEAFLIWLRQLYAQEKDLFSGYKESQLEEHWFKPILARLGHVYERQASVPGLGQNIKYPDYVFFPDQASRKAAIGTQKTGEYTAHALAVGEVKHWDCPLGKKQRGGGASFEAQNPSWQIDYYLRSTSLAWGILSNGRLWRLVHKDTSQRLSIYYEVDLVDLLSRGEAEAMRHFVLFFRQTAFRPDAQGRVFLDDALSASNAYAVALEEDLQQNVYQALERLMQGFLDLPKNKLGEGDLRQVYDNSLYLLYRLLFILYGESHGLLPLQNDVHRTNYSLARIKEEIAELKTKPVPRSTLYWGRVKNLFHIINGADAELNRSLGVPRYNGGLFDPDLHPFLEGKEVGDLALVEAIDLLSRRSTPAGREFVDYRTLGVRHLGSIYEGLLEYQPRYATGPLVAIHDGKGERWVPAGGAPKGAGIVERREAGQIYLETDRGERKATGSYYTPQYIVEYIVENTLGQLVDEAAERVKARVKDAKGKVARARAEQSLVDEILKLKVLDPAMGSGHFLVEATDFLALALATDPYVETEAPVEEDLTYWKRQVVERCIYGVDKNPLAVELAKLSLWLATVAADKPLSFLDHHLRCGDSLVGARVTDLGSAPPVVLTKKALKQLAEQRAGQLNMFEYRLSQLLPAVMGKILEITEVESDSYETVQAKETADRAVRELKAPFEAIANLWVSAYFGNEFTRGKYETAVDLLSRPEELLALPPVQQANAMAAGCEFFHWELAFPEVFYDQHGQFMHNRAGFDAVVGNPPWVNVGREPGNESLVQYLKVRFETAEYQIDLYTLFLEVSLRLLQKDSLLSMIVPDPWLANYRTPKIRKLLLVDSQPVQIANTPRDAFPEVGAEHLIIIVQHSQGCVHPFVRGHLDRMGHLRGIYEFSCDMLKEQDGYVVHSTNQAFEILRKIEDSSHSLGDLFETIRGVGPYHHRKHSKEIIKARAFHADHKKDNSFVPELKGEHLAQYEITWDGHSWISYGDWLAEPREERFFRGRRLLLREILSHRFAACVLEEPFVVDRSIYIALQGNQQLSLYYVLAAVESSLLIFWFREKFSEWDELFPKLRVVHFNILPIRRIEFTTPTDERERLAGVGITEATDWIENTGGSSANSMTFGAFSDSSLGRWLDERLVARPEQADVVHDLLTHLAGQMIEMNKQKQAATEAFWLDMEGVSEVDTFEALRNKGKQEATLWKRAKACQPFVSQESRSTRRLDESLGWDEEAFKAFVKALVGKVKDLGDLIGVYRKHSSDYRELVERIAATDRLIDLIVYRLYGLAEEEVAIVEKGERR